MPHTERATTVKFLEECITYIQNLQKRQEELEHLAGVTQPTISCPASAVLPGHPSLLTGVPISFSNAVPQPTASAVPGPARSQVPLEPPGLYDTAAITAR